MCGIIGFTGKPKPQLLNSMCQLIVHRGPDDDGFFEDPHVSMGMRRLSIIDLAGGHQPICNEAEDVWTVFNGEIYNYEALRSELQTRGHRFRTNSDTETIVHAYEEYGLDFLSKLRGMFGIALWDQKRQRLVIARDRIGEKPLYYSIVPDGVVFASEMKAILLYLESYSIDPDTLRSFLTYGFVPEDRTFFREIRKVKPGHFLSWKNGSLEERQFWNIDDIQEADISMDSSIDGLDLALDDAVRGCLKSDVEVGAFLSGGLDSSLLTALVKKSAPEVKTFTVGYEGEASGFNELEYARRVADYLKTDHHELILGSESSIEMLPKLLWHYDEPHGEPTSALVYRLTEFTRQHVKVALGGTGADELFYGYPRHKGLGYLSKYERIPLFLRSQLIEPTIRALPESTQGSRFSKRAKRFVNGLADTPLESYINWTVMFTTDEIDSLLSDDVQSKLSNSGAYKYYEEILGGDEENPLMRNIATLDLSGYLPEYQLAYMDRMSMATSLEVRSPFCDYRLIEYAHSLPWSYRLHNGTTKYVLKKVAESYLPKDIVHRKKVGFDSPIGQWLKSDLREFVGRFLSAKELERSGIFNPASVATLIDAHNAGKRDLSLHIWSILAIEMWFRMYFELPFDRLGSCDISDIRGT